jgi:hypothetical protein
MLIIDVSSNAFHGLASVNFTNLTTLRHLNLSNNLTYSPKAA